MQLIETKLNEIANLLKEGIACWERAGAILVEQLDAGTTIKEAEEATGIPANVLCQLERIGRKQIVPRLLISDYPAARAMEKLPYSEQSRLQSETVEIIVTDAGKYDILNVLPSEMTPHQVRQAFASGHVRTLSEQKAWVADQRGKSVVKTAASDYKVSKNEVTFFVGGSQVTYSRQQLARILAELS